MFPPARRAWCAALTPKGRNVNKAQLIDAVAEKLEISRRAAGEAVDAVLDGITGAVVTGDKVSLTGFGTFESARRPARIARNPRTGEQVRVAAATVPKFRAGQAFKDEVNGSRPTARKGAAKKTTARKATGTAAKRATAASRPATKKATATKKTAMRKTTATKATSTRGTTTKAAVTKAAAKTTAKKTAAKKGAARPVARKTAAIAPATKMAAKKTAAKKSVAKKSAKKR
jgi:DNA-binding protein HU-beta